MEKLIIKIVVTLSCAAIICGASAVVKVHVLDNDMIWIKKALLRIECKIDGETNCNN